MKQETFTLKVYDKGINTDGAWKIVMISGIPVILACSIMAIFFTNEQLKDSVLAYIILGISFLFVTALSISIAKYPFLQLCTLHSRSREIQKIV